MDCMESMCVSYGGQLEVGIYNNHSFLMAKHENKSKSKVSKSKSK
jgi:hypothetical protein